MDEFQGNSVGIGTIHREIPLVGAGRNLHRRRLELHSLGLQVGISTAKVIDIESQVSAADVIGLQVKLFPPGIKIFDELQAMPRGLEIGDFQMGPWNAGHLFREARLSLSQRNKFHPQKVPVERNGSLYVTNRKTRVIYILDHHAPPLNEIPGKVVKEKSRWILTFQAGERKEGSFFVATVMVIIFNSIQPGGGMADRSGIQRKPQIMGRREFLRLLSISAAGLMAGCAANPVTGRRQLMFVSEEEEVQIDKQYSPLQFSSDYGPVQDQSLNDYVSQVGRNMVVRSHRTHMPYSFRVVNATYVNAYAFPGGSIACTRGILLSLGNEAELAALLGHELGHVNARHTAQQMSKGMLTNTIVGGVSVAAGAVVGALGQLTGALGSIGAGALLASYSRENEREADALGMEYMVKAGYDSRGMVELMDMLRSLSKDKPSTIELMFATHPMSDERYQIAVKASQTQYPSPLPLYRERYMDYTAKLRSLKGAIEEMEKGQQEMTQKKFGDAEIHFQKALKQAPEDYAGLVFMATCQLVQKKNAEGIRYAEKAKAVYPQEAQAYHLSGFARLQTQDFQGAYRDFSSYEKLLPGNPSTLFFKGFALEGMDNKPEAAQEYHQYLQIIQKGKFAQYAYQRLVEWGYYKR